MSKRPDLDQQAATAALAVVVRRLNEQIETHGRTIADAVFQSAKAAREELAGSAKLAETNPQAVHEALLACALCDVVAGVVVSAKHAGALKAGVEWLERLIHQMQMTAVAVAMDDDGEGEAERPSVIQLPGAPRA